MSLLSEGTTGLGKADEGLESYAGDAPSAPLSAPSASGQKKPSSGVFAGLRVSLMPSDLEGATGPDLGKRLLVLALVLIVETLAIGGAYYYLTQKAGAQTQKRAELQTRIADVEKSVAQAEALAKESVAWNAQKAAAKEALDNHIYWTSFFRFVESKTLPSVKYLNFSGDADSGTVTLDSIGATYRDVAEQILIFRGEPMVNDVRTSAASARVDNLGNVTGVSFTMIIKFKPELWKTMPSVAAADAASSTVPAAAAQPAENATVPSSASSVPDASAPAAGDLPGTSPTGPSVFGDANPPTTP